MVEATRQTESIQHERVSSLAEILRELEPKVDTDASRTRLELAYILKGKLEISKTAAVRIQRESIEEGVIEMVSGKRFDKDGALALAAICFVVKENFRQTQPLVISWERVIEETREALGENHQVSRRLRVPANSDRVLSIEMTPSDFFRGRNRRSAYDRDVDKVEGVEEATMMPTWLEEERAMEIARGFNIKKLTDLYESLRGTIDTVRYSAEMPPSIIAKIVEISCKSRRQVSPQEPDSVSSFTFKVAVRDCVELLKTLDGVNDLAQLDSLVMRSRYARTS
ncbi:MAG: hypothetical protein NUV69_05460 [Candidatus Curtissbacteria bacterium]|nr:hypothetical protein [Candidatus Curtissbacteria bacterium]